MNSSIAQELLFERFQVKPKLEDSLDIYNHLTGNDGKDKNEYGDTVITAVWNMEPFDFLYDYKYIDFWTRSRNCATSNVAKFMDKYSRYAKKYKIRRYKDGTCIERLECW